MPEGAQISLYLCRKLSDVHHQYVAVLENCVFSKGIHCTVMFAMLLVVSGSCLFIITNISVNLYAAVNGKVAPSTASTHIGGMEVHVFPCVLNFCTRWSCKLHVSAASTRKKTPVPIDGRQRPCAHFGGRTSLGSRQCITRKF